MPESSRPFTTRRHTMRSLRSGRVYEENTARTEGSATGEGDAHGGRIPTEEGFHRALTKTIGEAVSSGRAVFVFRFHSRLLGLQQWCDFMPVADADMENAIDELVLSLDENMVILRTARREILGFNAEPMTIGAAERLGGRVVAGLTTSLGSPGEEFVVSPRLGVAVIDSQQSSEQAIEAATRTLRQTNFDMPFLVHNDFVRDRSLRQELARAELPEALTTSQITVEFQPRVSTETMKPVGLEVFPRWHHPERGLVPTLDFLQVAERSGLLVDLGRTVRDMAAEIANGWAEKGILERRRLWMNISPIELCHADFLNSVQELSRTHPEVPLGFEVSDSRVLEDPVFFRIFDKLEEYGAALALDNIRSSSLSIGRLRRLPLSNLNLDGELIRGLPSRSSERNLVRLLCSHAAGQRMLVTACEVETAEQFDVVASLGVDTVQGTFISPPMVPDRVAAFLRTGAAPPEIGPGS